MLSTRLPAPRRRRQLLDVALAVFADRGFHGTSMNDIAAAAGVTKPVLYQHFRSKRSLYVELVDDIGRQLHHAVASATARTSDFEEQVDAIFSAYFVFVADRPGSFDLLFGGDARSDIEFADVIRQLEDALAGEVASLAALGHLDPGHRRLLGHGLFGLAEATARQWSTAGLTGDAADVAREVAALAWSGLRGAREAAPALLAAASQ